jgi:fucose permease
MMMVLNGMLNNIIIPLESTISNIYGVSNRVVNLSTILSFLAFLTVNIPANYILDKRGLKFGYLVGNSLYLIGTVFACCINIGFPFAIIGYLLFTLGQPFILNAPAKLATYWFFPENVS